MAINIAGVIGIAVFYLIILIIGLWAARRRSSVSQNEAGRGTDQNGSHEGQESKEVMLAGRNIGVIIGAFTMTATWVGGGYINGTAEVVNRRGLAWAQSSWGYSISLVLGGFMFAKIMRQRGYVTLLDPFQERYGVRVGSLMYLPAFLGELLWSAGTLNSLGATIHVVMDLSMNVSVIVSACIAILYTFLGGLWSVAYTDVAQLICMAIGMWLTIPFALSNEAVSRIETTSSHWAAGWEWSDAGIWFDYSFLLIFGGIPWQVYFQRVLSSKSYKRAQYLSFAAALGCLLMSVPSILIGAIGRSTDWERTGYNSLAHRVNGTITYEYHLTMPLVLQYLTPPAVSFIGLGAVSAAVMSSVDSSVLSASSMFAHNIYKAIIRQNASDKEMVWVIRISIIVVGAIATTIGLAVRTVYGLSILCSDLIFVILFPQLVCVLYFTYSNSYGAAFSFVIGLFLRLLCGESTLGLEAILHFPFYDGDKAVQRFPFRTFAMLFVIISQVASSILIHLLFQHRKIPLWLDPCGCFEGEIKPFRFCDMFSVSGVPVTRNHRGSFQEETVCDKKPCENGHLEMENKLLAGCHDCDDLLSDSNDNV